MTPIPHHDDVIARIKRGNPSTVYVLGTASTPDQFIVRTRDEAVSKAIAYAKRERVRAWLAGDDGLVLLGTFGGETVEPAIPSEALVQATFLSR